MDSLPALSAAVLYGLATLLQQGSRPQAGVVMAAVLLHGFALALAVGTEGGIVIGVGQAGSLFAWQAAFLLWVFSLRQPLHALGLVIYPLAAAGALWGWYEPADPASPISGWRTQLHVLLSLLSAGLLTLAAAQAGFLAAQDRLLHHPDRRGLMERLPPLQTMEKLLFQLIGLGFLLLSLSLLSGLWFIHDWFSQHLVHKTVLSLTAWLVFAVLLWGRLRSGWRGRTAIRWALSGYGLLLLAYFGSKYILEEILGRHWS